MEERKYSVIGKVEIGTDEYRDLIEQTAKAEASADNYMHKYWDEQAKVKKLTEECDKLRNQLELFSEIINKNKPEEETK